MVPGQDKYCINFTRKRGSLLYFYDVIQEQMEAMENFQDVGLDAN